MILATKNDYATLTYFFEAIIEWLEAVGMP